MKIRVILIAVVSLIIACDNEMEHKSNHIVSDGTYIGYFSYDDTKYWYSITLEDGKYVEWPSGGAYYQKSMVCLTEGSYSIVNDKISFELGTYKFSNFPAECKTIMCLPDEYSIVYSNNSDSLVFKKEKGDDEVIYYLSK